jgi:hypothetical protein
MERQGCPFVVACQSVGISVESFYLWRQTDERLARDVDTAEAESIKANLDTIKKASREQWSAAAWLLERRRPELFSRPEVQLNLAVQNNMNTNGAGDGNSFQMAVVSDLDYIKLQNHPSYKHHADSEQQPIEIEAERVPEEASGYLTKQGVAGAVVISEAQAKHLDRRIERAATKFDQFIAAKKLKQNAATGELT